jgi:hypothetical protein
VWSNILPKLVVSCSYLCSSGLAFNLLLVCMEIMQSVSHGSVSRFFRWQIRWAMILLAIGFGGAVLHVPSRPPINFLFSHTVSRNMLRFIYAFPYALTSDWAFSCFVTECVIWLIPEIIEH